jgi:hypothetical protein
VIRDDTHFLLGLYKKTVCGELGWEKEMRVWIEGNCCLTVFKNEKSLRNGKILVDEKD